MPIKKDKKKILPKSNLTINRIEGLYASPTIGKIQSLYASPTIGKIPGLFMTYNNI